MWAHSYLNTLRLRNGSHALSFILLLSTVYKVAIYKKFFNFSLEYGFKIRYI